jgi:hypothetical protein
MGNITIEEWNKMTLQERIDACYDHYAEELHNLRLTQEDIDMHEYITIKTILGVLDNIRGHV